MQVIKTWIPGGDAGIIATVNHMAALARQGRTDPMVRATATQIVRDIPGRDGTQQAYMLRAWLESHTLFVRDPTGAELLHSPRLMLDTLRVTRAPLSIDCDDVAVLGVALGGAIGLHAQFVVVGFFSPNAPFQHVWCELRGVLPTDPWVDLDVTRNDQALPAFQAISRTWRMGVY